MNDITIFSHYYFIVAQVTISFILLYVFVNRENTLESMRMLNISVLFAFFIWVSPVMLFESQSIANDITKVILIVIDTVLIYFALTLKRRLKKESLVLSRIENEKKRLTEKHEKESLIEQSKQQIGTLIEDYDLSTSPNFMNAIQMVLFTETNQLPHKIMTNTEFYEELEIIHPLVEELLIVANELHSSINLLQMNDGKNINPITFRFLTDPLVTEHYGLPRAVGFTPNPLIKLLRGCIKGAKGENRLERELGEDFKENTIYYNINLSDGVESVEIDALMIIGNAVLTFESKHYSADTITFEKSGQAKITKNKKTQIIDVVSQMNRHYRILRNIVGETIDIYNFFVLTDKKTQLVNGFENKYLKVAFIDGLSFFVRSLELVGSEEKEEIINDILRNAEVEEKTYNNIDLRYLRQLLEKHASNGILDIKDSINFMNALKYSNLVDSETNATYLAENLEIYKKLYDITKKHLIK